MKLVSLVLVPEHFDRCTYHGQALGSNQCTGALLGRFPIKQRAHAHIPTEGSNHQ